MISTSRKMTPQDGLTNEHIIYYDVISKIIKLAHPGAQTLSQFSEGGIGHQSQMPLI